MWYFLLILINKPTACLMLALENVDVKKCGENRFFYIFVRPLYV